MKKSLVAAGVIIALGAAWTGASWYTGKQLAQNLDGFIDNINSQLKTNYPETALKVVYRDYQGGIFSSKVTLVVQYDGSDKWQRPLAPGEEIVINDIVYHGPFPLAQLKKFNLLPSMAYVHAELANTPVVKPLFDLTQNKPFFTADSRVAYSGDISSDVTLLPLEYQGNEQKFSFSGSEIEFDVASDFRSNKLSGIISHILIEKKNPWGEMERFTLKDLALNVNNHKGKFDLSLGDGNLTTKSLTFSVEGGEPVALNNFSLQSSVTEDDKNLASKTAMTLESLTIGERNLGSGNLNLSLSQFDGEGTKRFAADYRKMIQQIEKNPANGDPQIYQQQVLSILLQNLPNLLKGNPNITIAPLSWKNSKGESTFTLSLDMTDPLQNGATAVNPGASDEEKIIRQSIRKFEAKLNAPLAMLAELMVQSEKQPESAEEKEQLNQMALQQVQMLASIGQMNKLSVTKNDVLTSSLQYADGKVDFNGNKMTLTELLSPFLILPDAEEDDDAQPQSPEEPAAPSAQ